MEQPTIHKDSIHGKYLVCQWTQYPLARAYGAPRVDKSGNLVLDPLTKYPKRMGSFADAAAAASFVNLKMTEGKLTESEGMAYLQGIKKDMGFTGSDLPLAPFVPLDFPGNKLEYQNQIQEMIPDNDHTFTVDQLEFRKSQKKTATPKSTTPNPEPDIFYSAEFNSQPGALPHVEKSLVVSLPLDNYDRLVVAKCPKTRKRMGNKVLTLLHRRPVDPKLSEQPNLPLQELTGLPNLQGDYLVVSQKTPCSAPSTPASTSSSQSSRSGSTRKSSKKRSAKKSAAPQAPSADSATKSQKKTSRKRKASALDSPADSGQGEQKSSSKPKRARKLSAKLLEQ